MGCTIQGHKTGDLCQLQLLGDCSFPCLAPVSIWVSGISRQFRWSIAKGFRSCFCQAPCSDGDGARKSSGSHGHGHRCGQPQILALCQTVWFCVGACSTDCMCPLPEGPGEENPLCLSLTFQGCCSLTYLAGEIKKSVQCFGCVNADIQLGQGKAESVLGSSPCSNTGPGGV